MDPMSKKKMILILQGYSGILVRVENKDDDVLCRLLVSKMEKEMEECSKKEILK